jgi:putative transposase
VTVRGNDKQDIVRCDGDRLRLLDQLRQVAKIQGLTVHAYVIMTNHFHLLATGDRPESLPNAMQALGRRYVGYFNHRHDRSGTLWEGRYKSSLVASVEYIFNCHRYIDLNPVRAGIVVSPDEFEWSSHAFYTRRRPDDLVTPHDSWLSLGDSDEIRRATYFALFDRPMTDDVIANIRIATESGRAIGSEADCKRLEARIGQKVTAGRRGWRKGVLRRQIKESDPII